jgi:Ca2+/H+ antiporter
MNYVFMDGKSDYFQGVVLLVIYIIMIAVLLW